MASWQLILFGCLMAVALSTALDCVLDGQTYADQSTFDAPTSHCIKLTCNNGEVTAKPACDHNGECFPLGHELIEQCVKKVCKDVPEKGIGFFIEEMKCESDDGCVAPGTIFPKTIKGKVWSKTRCILTGDIIFYEYRN